jgi:hypothetical protein
LRGFVPDYGSATVADFSPGPWWGFNGVRTLVLTDERLHVLQRGLFSRRLRARRTLKVADISAVKLRTTDMVVHMTVATGHRRRWYASKYQQGADLADRLARQACPG